MKNKKTILYDGICHLCNAWCRLVIHYNRESVFEMISMQSKKGQNILTGLNLPVKNFNSILLIDNNISYKKSTAILKILQQLSYPVKILAVLKYTPEFFRDFIYSIIANNRYKWFGKYDECKIPPIDKLKQE